MNAGYSGTPLAKKLGIKEGSLIYAVDPPGDLSDLLGPLPSGAQLLDGPQSEIDIVHLFTNSRDGLLSGLSHSLPLIKQNGAIWVSWFKRAAKLPTEITEDAIRQAAFPLGLVDVKVCAVDDKWSGLKLVIRKENRL